MRFISNFSSCLYYSSNILYFRTRSKLQYSCFHIKFSSSYLFIIHLFVGKFWYNSHRQFNIHFYSSYYKFVCIFNRSLEGEYLHIFIHWISVVNICYCFYNFLIRCKTLLHYCGNLSSSHSNNGIYSKWSNANNDFFNILWKFRSLWIIHLHYTNAGRRSYQH